MGEHGVSSDGAELHELQKAIHYHFNEVKLLQTALTHSSFANEGGLQLENNERLEFLGDAALELAVSTELYTRYPRIREGELTRMRARLVSQPSLADLALECGLHTHIRLGRGEENQGGRIRPSLLSDAMEALLGAIYLDGGLTALYETIAHLFRNRWPAPGDAEQVKDNKSMLQEQLQRLFKERPVYNLVESTGPEHAKVFTVRVRLADGASFTCQGPSMKRAEQAVAGEALDYLEERYREELARPEEPGE